MFENLNTIACVRARANTIHEVIALAEHFRDGGRVEYWDIRGQAWRHVPFNLCPSFDFNNETYRIVPA